MEFFLELSLLLSCTISSEISTKVGPQEAIGEQVVEKGWTCIRVQHCTVLEGRRRPGCRALSYLQPGHELWCGEQFEQHSDDKE